MNNGTPKINDLIAKVPDTHRVLMKQTKDGRWFIHIFPFEGIKSHNMNDAHKIISDKISEGLAICLRSLGVQL